MLDTKDKIRRIQKAGDKLEAYADLLEIMNADRARFSQSGRYPSASEYMDHLIHSIAGLGKRYQDDLKK